MATSKMCMAGCAREKDWYLPLPLFSQKEKKKKEKTRELCLACCRRAQRLERADAGLHTPPEKQQNQQLGWGSPPKPNTHTVTPAWLNSDLIPYLRGGVLSKQATDRETSDRPAEGQPSPLTSSHWIPAQHPHP